MYNSGTISEPVFFSFIFFIILLIINTRKMIIAMGTKKVITNINNAANPCVATDTLLGSIYANISFLLIFVLIFSFLDPLVISASTANGGGGHPHGSISDNSIVYTDDDGNVIVQTEFDRLWGGALAGLGYNFSNSSSYILNSFGSFILDYCNTEQVLTEEQLLKIQRENGDYDATNAALLSAMLENGQLIYDAQNQSFSITSDIANMLKDYLEQEQISDYVVLNTFSLSDVSSSYLREKSRYQSYIDELSDDEFKLFAFSPYNYVLMSESTYNFTDYGAVIDSTINPTCDDLLSRYAHFKYNVYSPGGYEFTSDSRIQVQLFNVSSLNINSYIRYFRFTFGTSEPDYINSNEFLFSDFPATNRFFVFPVSKDIIYFPVFKDTETFYNYIGGTLGCYRTDPTYSGSGDLVINSNMDPEALYDAISKAIQELDTVNTKDIQSAIQKVTEDYFESLIKNTEDIADNTTQLVSLTEKMLAKLDDIYLDLTGFHSDFLENFSDLLSQVSSGFTNIVNHYSAFQDVLFYKLDHISETLDNMTFDVDVTNNTEQTFNYIIDNSTTDIDFSTDIDISLKNLVDITNEQIIYLDLGLKDLIKKNNNKFPFSIPSDMLFMFSQFSASPEAPVFVFDFVLPGLTSQQVIIDLSNFNILSKLSRAFFAFIFIAALIPVTLKILDYNEKIIG